MVKNFWPSKVETSELSSFWWGNKNFPLFSSVVKLRTLPVVICTTIKQRSEWTCKNFSKKEPRAREYNCQVGERSSWYRLQNSPYFYVFKYARAVKQKVYNEAENRERDRGVLSPRALRACKTLTPRFTDFFTDFEKKTDFILCILRFSHQILLCEKAFRILLRPIREAKRVSHMWKNRFVQSQTTV